VFVRGEGKRGAGEAGKRQAARALPARGRAAAAAAHARKYSMLKHVAATGSALLSEVRGFMPNLGLRDAKPRSGGRGTEVTKRRRLRISAGEKVPTTPQNTST
jgi:hypothetical protein